MACGHRAPQVDVGLVNVGHCPRVVDAKRRDLGKGPKALFPKRRCANVVYPSTVHIRYHIRVYAYALFLRGGTWVRGCAGWG